MDLYYSNPTFKSVYIFQIHLCFPNWFKFFKQTLVTSFFFPKRLIFSKSFSIFQSKIKIALYISNQLNNFHINLYFPNQLNWHFKSDLLITKLSKFFESFSAFQIKKYFWNRKIFWIFYLMLWLFTVDVWSLRQLPYEYLNKCN